MVSFFVNGEIWRLDIDFDQVLPAGEMKSAGFVQEVGALFQEVGDVFARKRLEGEGILDGPPDFFRAMDFAQGDNLLHVVTGFMRRLSSSR